MRQFVPQGCCSNRHCFPCPWLWLAQGVTKSRQEEWFEIMSRVARYEEKLPDYQSGMIYTSLLVGREISKLDRTEQKATEVGDGHGAK
jgi:hypothetical protein